MNTLKKLIALATLSVGALFAMAEPASAQFPRIHRRLFGIVPAENLARLEVVQKEIGLSEEQIKQISDMNKRRNDESRKLFESANGDFDAINDGVKKMNTSYFEELNKACDEKQRKRMMEVYLQVNQGVALADETVAKQLNIAEEQVKKLDELTAAWRNKVFESFQEMGDLSEEERLKKQGEMVDTRDKEMLAVLTDDQRKALETMQGAKLEVDLDQLPPFGE